VPPDTATCARGRAAYALHACVGGRRRSTCVQVPYNGDFLLRPAARNEVPLLVQPLAHVSIWLNEWLGFHDDKQLRKRHPAVQRAVRRFKARGYYVDLRRLFEHQSLAFLGLTSTALYYLMCQFATQGVALLIVGICQSLVFAYCTMW
jgi:hypothetical protein